MQLPLQISARNVSLSPEVEMEIRAEVESLSHFYDRIMGCRVMVEAPHRYPSGESVRYNVRLDLTVPGGEVVIRRQPESDLRTAVQRAVEAARRRLQDYARRQRGEVKAAQAGPRGRVSRLFPAEGYGFLTTADGREVYFGRNAVVDNAFDRLNVGVEVRFVEAPGREGPQASTVSLVGKGRRPKERVEPAG